MGLLPRLAFAGAVLCVGAVLVAAWGAPSDAAVGRGLLELLVVGIPLAAGIYALRAPVTARFGIALVVISYAWSLTALAEASASVPYTIGRTSIWLIVPSIYYLLLVFPDGRVGAGRDRWLLRGMVAVAVFLFFGTSFFVKAYPLHTPWASCVSDCPANAWFVLGREPAVMNEVLVPLREWLVDLLLAGLVVSMVAGWRGASPLRRRMSGPVVAMGTLMAAALVAFYAARRYGASSGAVEALGAGWTLTVIAVVVAFALGLIWRRVQLAGVLARLAGTLRDDADPRQVRRALADALGDPELDLLVWDEASSAWRTTDGQEVSPSQPGGPGRGVTRIGGQDEGFDVALVHDVALGDDEELIVGVSGLVLAGWRHQRVLLNLTRAMAELEASRHRIAESADRERARIERDLHDGAQQRLIGLRLKLSLAEETLHSDPAAGAAAVHALGLEADRALADLRALARGVYPPALQDLGLKAALQALARESTIPVHLSTSGLTRQPTEIETAVYFVCVEAIQNAMKHAPTATGVWISLRQDHNLDLEVRDDGPGFPPNANPHGGLRNMRDRIDAIAGQLKIDASPGNGTRILGRVPLG